MGRLALFLAGSTLGSASMKAEIPTFGLLPSKWAEGLPTSAIVPC